MSASAARWANPITLAGKRAVLVPLNENHADDLAEASADGDLSKLWYTSVPAPNEMLSAVRHRLELQRSGEWLPFAVLDPQTRRAVGMTCYLHIVPHVRRLEIGATWYRRSVQRSGMNVESKLLLLRHAFEQLDCIAVEFRTNRFNQQSRIAIERLGAQLDGVLRNHFDAFGAVRDTCVYSIIASEWPQVKTHLEWRLQ
jgi:RimJ/RimL family protein N-acetyltransferase